MTDKLILVAGSFSVGAFTASCLWVWLIYAMSRPKVKL